MVHWWVLLHSGRFQHVLIFEKLFQSIHCTHGGDRTASHNVLRNAFAYITRDVGCEISHFMQIDQHFSTAYSLVYVSMG
jgi:hypothetical protein